MNESKGSRFSLVLELNAERSFDHVPRPITRAARIPLLHVSRICIESRHNEADYRKIVHEYLESGQVGEVSTPNVERVSKYRRDADRFRDDERERDDRLDRDSTLFNDLRISKGNKFADNKGDRIVKSKRAFCHCSIVLSPVIRVKRERRNSHPIPG